MTTDKNQPAKTMLSTRQASAFLGVTEDMMNSWRHRKIGPPYYRMGRTIRYCEADLRAFIEDAYVCPNRPSTMNTKCNSATKTQEFQQRQETKN